MNSLQEKLEEIENIDLNNYINLPYLLQKRSLNGTLSSRILNKFSIEGIKNNFNKPSSKILKWEKQNPKKDYNIYIREKHGLVLTFDNIPQSIISFQINPDELYLTQLKGIKAQNSDGTEDDPKGLRYVEGVPVMFEIGIDFAKKFSIEKFIVQSSINRNDKIVNRNLLWKLYHIFDEIPFDLGFSQKDNLDSYIELKTIP